MVASSCIMVPTSSHTPSQVELVFRAQVASFSFSRFLRHNRYMENLSFTTSIEGIDESQLQGFFVGWLSAPTPGKHLQLLRNSDYAVLAIDSSTKKVVGFVTAITDKTLAAYIPFLEVLPAYQKKGIGKELTTRMLETLKDFYMVDLLCDSELQPFYENVGMNKATGMMRRNYDKQGGI